MPRRQRDRRTINEMLNKQEYFLMRVRKDNGRDKEDAPQRLYQDPRGK